MKANLIILFLMIKRRVHKAVEKHQLKVWYNTREMLAQEQHSSVALLLCGLILLLCIAVGAWPFVMFIKYGEFLFGY